MTVVTSYILGKPKVMKRGRNDNNSIALLLIQIVTINTNSEPLRKLDRKEYINSIFYLNYDSYQNQSNVVSVIDKENVLWIVLNYLKVCPFWPHLFDE